MVNMKKYLTVISIIFTLVSCEDSYEVKTPDFSVATEKNSYVVGEKVKFDIEGSVDMINFYSGEIGNDYAYHNIERIYDMEPSLSFNIAKFSGDNEDSAELLYTTDFNEDYSFENVKNVNWTNISDLFNIPPIVGTTASFSDGGKVDISSFVEEGKPIYFAWYCKTNESSLRTRLQVREFNVNGEVLSNSDLSGVLVSQQAMDFVWALSEEAANQPSNIPAITGSLIYWDGVYNNSEGSLKEGYAVSGPINITDQINLGLDKPQVIKSVAENVKEFFYVFEKPGEYEVAFVGFNVNFNGRKEVIKKIKLIIE